MSEKKEEMKPDLLTDKAAARMEEEDRKLKKQKGLNRPVWWIVMREGRGGGGQASVRTKASVSRCVCLLLVLCFSCAEFVPASTSCVCTP